MLSEELKDRIRAAYAAVIEGKSLSPRWGQRQMIAEIANALARIPGPGEAPPAEPAVCVIEAGTGTGKTIAYAVTAIPMAQALGKRLVVATATVALQEQFVNKDLPDIKRHSGLDFSYALAKGRRRYVCLSKLDRQLAQGQGESGVLPLYPDEFELPQSAEALPIYTAMLDALGRGEWDGDRDNWPGAVPEVVWFGATTDHSQCSGRRCPNIAQCSFYRAREELTHADVIVANHDLVLADLALGGGAILPEPENCIYVFDEGHHLPDKALSHFASFCRLHTTIAWLQDSGKSLAQGAATLGALEGIRHCLKQLPEQLESSAESLKVAEQVVAGLFEGHEARDGRDEVRLRFEHGLVPESLIPVAGGLAGQFRSLASNLSRIESALEDALEDEHAGVDKGELETWHLSIGGMLGRAESTLALWEAYAVSGEGEQPPMARWITLLDGGGGHGFELRCSPILAADLLNDYLWPRAAGVIVTSATITALNSFERFILHSGVSREARFKAVASPFDYSRAVFAVPKMDCDPGDAERHTAAMIELLPRVLDPGQASLVLFSSRRQMLEVFAGLDDTWRERTLVQGDASKQEVLRRHRERVDSGRGSVIFGLASFAEGVDLPGRYCDHVVIAKIPFAVPDSPIEASLAEWIEDRGGNAFMEISVPDAALRLVQASGRLLRSESDSGRVTLMDRRILTRRYGRAILDSLPPFRRELQ
ncbi:ATP-dependent DNA helicase DinG [Parahaliea mediterranea]|uniref:ATP-dependent DNA helicase DinG n=1 Tax=Parahaliea mediterranea TaxID=651086 RepID=A0A939DIX1_9GAMM|nr:ATP-dependent DNA helicase DinG [Parahaliea mediterranea]